MNMHFGTRLDLTKIEPAAEYEYVPLPEGVYKVVCHEFEVTEKDWGIGAKVKFTVVEGEHTGRKANDFFIITHRNAQAQDIGQRRLRSWCDALGIPATLESGEPLIGKVVLAKIKIDPAREKDGKVFNAQNRIEYFLAAEDESAAVAAPKPVTRPAVAASPAPKAAVAAAPATTQAVASKSMPWKR